MIQSVFGIFWGKIPELAVKLKTGCFLPVPSPGTDTPQTPSLYSRLEANAEHPEGDEVFFDMLVKCQVGWRSQISVLR